MNPRPSLRICRTNAGRFTLPLADWQARGWTLDCVDCLAQCGDCEAGPFVELNNAFLFADNLPHLSTLVADSTRSPA